MMQAMRHFILAGLVVLTMGLAIPVSAQTDTEPELTACPAVAGITCDGWVTDAAGVLRNEAVVESAAGAFVRDS